MAFTDNYCTPELARKYCNDLQTADEDVFLGVVIGAASRRVEHLTHRYFGPSATISNEQVKSIIGKDGSMFYSGWAPIISVSSVSDNVKTYVEGTDFVVWLDEGKIENFPDSLTGQPLSFSKRPGQLKVTYVAGQGAAPSGELVGGVAAPRDIQLATAIIAGSFFNSKDRIGILARARGDNSVSFDTIGIPSLAAVLLAGHVRHLF